MSIKTSYVVNSGESYILFIAYNDAFEKNNSSFIKSLNKILISFGRIKLKLLSDFSFNKSNNFSFKELFFTGKIRFKNSLKFKL